MAYKRYIKRGNKLYGPYIYHSHKEGGKVISEYIGKGSVTNKNKKLFGIFSLFLGILAVSLFLFLFNVSFTGDVILQMKDSYSENENLSGYFSFVLEKEEFLPASTKIFINNSGEIYEYPLLDILEEPTEGEFYMRDTNISGRGLGYGMESKLVSFVLRIYNETAVNETDTNKTDTNKADIEINETAVNKTDTNQTDIEINETAINETEVNKTEDNESDIEINETAVNQTDTNKTEDNETDIGINETAINETEVNKTEDNDNEFGDNEIKETDNNKTENNETEVGDDEIKKTDNNETEIESIEDIQEDQKSDKNTIEDGESEKNDSKITGQAIGRLPNIFTNFYFALTGNSISGINIEGEVLGGERFVYNLSEGQNAEIVSSSNDINLIVEDNQIIVTTNSTSSKREIILSLEKLKIPARNGRLEISLVYDGTELSSFEKEISVKEELENETELNLSFDIEKRTKKQFKAVINRPVKWIEIIDTSNESIKIEIPKQARNITVKKGEEVEKSLEEFEEYKEVVRRTDKRELLKKSEIGITGQVSLDIEKERGFFSKILNFFLKKTITGNVISEEQIKENITETEKNKIIEIEPKKIGAENESIAVEYYTDAPFSNETISFGNKKRIIISSSDELNYTDILAYTLLDKKVPKDKVESIKLYWYASLEDAVKYGYMNEDLINNISENYNFTSNDSSFNSTDTSFNSTDSSFDLMEVKDLLNFEKVPIPSGFRIETDFEAYDLDGDGYLDYVEWIVPHLSNQIYEIVIEINKAEHLDENRDFISDITERVIKKDNNWSEKIGNSEYVRIYFEKNLTSRNDITFYARDLGDDSANVEIYTKDGNERISVIKNIKEEKYYKTYLLNLSENTSIFDLRIISNFGVEFDHIIDPYINVIINETNDYLYMQNRTESTSHGARLDAPVLFMNFNEENESDYVKDNSIYNNYGTINGNPIYDSSCSSPIGDGGGCYEFDGYGDYIEIPNNLGYSNKVSAFAWFKQKGTPAGDFHIIFGGQELEMSISNTGYLRTGVYTDSRYYSDYGSGLTDGNWHFVGFTFDGTNKSTYIDGEYVGSSDVSGTLTSSFSNRRIGRFGSSDTYYANGSIDNVQIWDRALEAWEIKELYDGTYNASETIGKYARTGNFSSYAYYNDTAIYWNITASIADSDGEGLNLSHPNLVSYWALDGDYEDSKGNNDGSCSVGTCPHNSTGLSSSAMLFDGEDDYLSISVSDSTTISYWKKNSTDSSWYHIINSSNGFYINGINTTYQTIYINKTVIGRSDSGYYFNGSLDEIAIYNKSLTTSEIDELYKIGLSQHADTNVSIFVRTANSYNLSNSKLVSFWSFNEQNADDEMDRNDGTVYGATWMQESGVVGGGYSFSDNDYINVDETESLNPSEISIEFWFNPKEDYNSETELVTLLSHSYYEVYIEDGRMVFEYEGSKINSSTSTWNKNQWYHVLVTYDGVSQTVYINSVNESSAVATLVAPFKIKDSAGNNVASFFDSGNLILKGKCFAKADCTDPGDTSFIIKNSGEVVAYINSSGDLCIEDSNCDDYDENCDNPGDNSFIVQNSTLNNVIYINSTGNLCLIRTLKENGNP